MTTEPVWLTTRVDALLAELEPALRGAATVSSVVLCTLSEPAEDASAAERERWERTCDRCGTYCPDETTFYTGTLTRDQAGVQVIIGFGICPACLRETTDGTG